MKEYYVDFGTMVVQAENEYEVEKIAIERMQRGIELPTIDIITKGITEE